MASERAKLDAIISVANIETRKVLHTKYIPKYESILAYCMQHFNFLFIIYPSYE